MHQMTDFGGERLLLAVQKNVVHDNQVAKYNVTACQMPHNFSDSSGMCKV